MNPSNQDEISILDVRKISSSSEESLTDNNKQEIERATEEQSEII